MNDLGAARCAERSFCSAKNRRARGPLGPSANWRCRGNPAFDGAHRRGRPGVGVNAAGHRERLTGMMTEAAMAGPSSQVAGERLDALRHAGAIWYAGVSLGVIGMTAIGHAVNPVLFRRFIGDADPTLVAMGVSALGALLLSVLVVRDGFSIAGPEMGRGLVRSTGLAALFGTVIIVVDFA